MITNEKLIETIREANGETTRITRSRIRAAAVELDLMDGCQGHETTAGAIGSTVVCDGTCESLPTEWDDDDADAICLAIKP